MARSCLVEYAETLGEAVSAYQRLNDYEWSTLFKSRERKTHLAPSRRCSSFSAPPTWLAEGVPSSSRDCGRGYRKTSHVVGVGRRSTARLPDAHVANGSITAREEAALTDR